MSQASSLPPAGAAGGRARGRKVQLGAMMFLQYAIWGAWAPVLASHLFDNLGFSGVQAGWIFALLPLATIIAPIVGGQVADRYFSTERFLAEVDSGNGVAIGEIDPSQVGQLRREFPALDNRRLVPGKQISRPTDNDGSFE